MVPFVAWDSVWCDRIAGKTIVRMSQYIIVAFGCFMGVMAIILLEIGLNLG